jgi:hypothetical protein
MKKEEEINKNSKNITKTETEKPPLNIDGWYMVFNVTFNNMSVISCQSVSFPVLLVDEIRVHGEKHRPVASHWKFYHIRYRVHLAMSRKCRLNACWAVAMGS